MILIADSGGTKIDWCLIEGLEEIRRIKTPGFNAALASQEDLIKIFKQELLPRFPESNKISEVYFYGAGCREKTKILVEKTLQTCLPQAKVKVYSDLLGAARGLCGTRRGIICILGTGSNTGLYDGKEIVENIPSLGYIIGDEGSGAVLGKLLIGDVFKNQLPKSLREKFFSRYPLTVDEVIDNVYRKPEPNRFLASVTPFLLEHIEEPAIHRLVLNNFKQFFIRNITGYPEFRNERINVTGSIGWYFKEILKEAAESMDCMLGQICASPIEGLVEYHCRETD